MDNLQKAIAITDARISFVSLVDKAANKRSFLITKATDGKVQFSTYGRIIKADVEHHFITGIVYEPNTEDAHGNFMTEEEITKAAYWYARNGNNVDLQHDFDVLENAYVVESWVAKANFKVGKETVKKGTWLMTVELTDDAIWDAVQNGKITGFSMGGVGKYDTENTDLVGVEKNSTVTANEHTERKGILKKLATMLGLDACPVENDEMNVPKNNETEEIEMTKNEIEKIVADAVAKSLNAPATGEAAPETPTVPEIETPAAPTEITSESVQKMVDEAVKKALAPKTEEKPLTAKDVQKCVNEAVKKALEPIMKSRALPTAIGGNGEGLVEKSGEQHYLAGIL